MKTKSPIPLIWDADGSPDSVVSLLYFLQHPGIKVKAATISCGQAVPDVFVRKLSRMFARIDRRDVPFSAGRNKPLFGNNAFPPPWRKGTNTFWGLELPGSGVTPYQGTAVDLLLQTLHRSPIPMHLFISGTQTNLAEALRIDPNIGRKIDSVHIMGGALGVPGNMHSEWSESDNEVSEWNIWVDPLAAQEVFQADVQRHLTPLDATNQVIWTRRDAQDWVDTGTKEGVLAGEILHWFLEDLGMEGFYFWDLLTAVNLTDPQFSRTQEAHIKVLVEPEAEQGRTVVHSDIPRNTTVFLEPDGEKVKSRVLEVLGF